MMFRDQRAPVWVIWGLVGLFGVVEAAAWIAAGGIPTPPGGVVQVVTAWGVVLILAGLAPAHRAPRAVRSARARAPHRERPGVPDLHRAGQRRGTAHTSPGGSRFQDRSVRARECRAFARG